ncbi:hypothetical protein [Planococcus lenghuensis]|nr:hypothetical protein [Planococcus lenghuensis]
MTENPLWAVFMVTTIVYGYLSMNTSVEHESETSNPRRSFIVGLIVVSVVATGVTVFTAFTLGFDWLNGLLIGGIIFICGLIPILYLYRLRKKKLIELEE